MAETNNNNEVTIVESWSFVSFAKLHGKPKFAPCVNQKGEKFNAIAFVNGNDITFAHLGKSTQHFTCATDVREKKDELTIGKNSNGRYSCYLRNSGWEDI